MFTPSSPSALARRLTDRVGADLERLVEHHCPGFGLPRVFAGHPVGADARADLLNTLSLLQANGVTEVAGTDLDSAQRVVLEPIDGGSTHTFFSYRVAEAVARHGALDDENPLLAPLGEPVRTEVEKACDSTEWIPLLDGTLPANYAAVLARCELDRERLGLEVDDGVVSDLVERVRRLLDANQHGYVDDSEEGAGGRYDIYSADIYLFTEPLAARLDDLWTRGARTMVDLVERTGARNGAAVTWGRSTGALAVCLTVELGALALARGLTDRRELWLARIEGALDAWDSWMADGVITAHRRRSTYHYRGPERRLQMTLDCLGKLAWSATLLRAMPDDGSADDGVADERSVDERVEAFPPVDELIRFDDRCGVWAFRSRDTAFVIPFVGPALSDYLPAPQNPELFEVPVDSARATGVPVIHAHGTAWAGGGRPTSIEHREGRVEAEWDGLPELPGGLSRGRTLPGRRRATFEVDGRTLHVTDEITLDEPAAAVSLQLTESEHRPLRVTFDSDSPSRASRIDVDGLKEYRSFWGELPTVHQIDVEPAQSLTLAWSVTPALRIASSELHHHYHRAVYDPLSEEGWVSEAAVFRHQLEAPDGEKRLRDIDIFHLHWPEWFIGYDLEAAHRFVAMLRRNDVKLVWTQHNLVPHAKEALGTELYQVFAEAADAVIHHSEWGRIRMQRQYDYGEQVVHRVIPHPHWAHLVGDEVAASRAELDRTLGLEPTALRLGIVGAPRAEKDVARFMQAFARVRRPNVQLVVFSLRPDERAPDDPRIIARPYEMVDRETYNRQVAALDAVVLPFDPGGDMLTTGVVGDVVALAKPAFMSEWGYLGEALGPAGVTFGWDPDQITDAIESLSARSLEGATEASRRLRPRYSNEVIAAAHLALFEELGTTKL